MSLTARRDRQSAVAGKSRVVIVMPAYNAARTLESTFRAIPEGYRHPRRLL